MASLDCLVPQQYERVVRSKHNVGYKRFFYNKFYFICAKDMSVLSIIYVGLKCHVKYKQLISEWCRFCFRHEFFSKGRSRLVRVIRWLVRRHLRCLRCINVHGHRRKKLKRSTCLSDLKKKLILLNMKKFISMTIYVLMK